MANTSNWKGSEAKAATLFPGKSHRRTRVGAGTYATVADDVKWLFPEKETTTRIQIMRKKKGFKKKVKAWMTVPKIVKKPITGKNGVIEPIYIEVKKRSSCAVVKMFRDSEKKYFKRTTDRLVFVSHVKGEVRQFVTVDDEFFKELIAVWYEHNGLDVMSEKDKKFARRLINSAMDSRTDISKK